MGFIERNFTTTEAQRNDDLDESIKYATMGLQFRGDGAAKLFRQRVGRTIRNNCNNVRPRIIFTSRSLIATSTKDRPDLLSTPNVIYQFNCSTCQERYIGMTERRLADRVKEHLPTWLKRTTDGTSRSSITDHIIEQGHSCKPEECFKILYRARNRRILRFVEAVAIRLYKPSLNVVKEFDLHLKLPWS